MSTKHHIIYVPGIKDDVFYLQSILVKFWRFYGVIGHCHPIPWAGQADYEGKFDRLLKEIDKYSRDGATVSLIGASAGASAVLNAYAERIDSINRVAIVCAKINNPETVGEHTYRANPAFRTSMLDLQTNLAKFTQLQLSKVRSYYSPTDNVVPYSATTFPGIEEVKLPPMRHGVSIFYSITIGSRQMIKFLKSA